MKETMDPVGAGESSEKDNFANRKLIRPTLPRAENYNNHNTAPTAAPERRERPERHERGERMDRGERSDRAMGGRRRQEACASGGRPTVRIFIIRKQMQSRTPMVIVLRDSEEVRGIIEWYDRHCIKVKP